jgi:hypothetical protein
MINVIQQPSNAETDSNIWWLIYDSDTNLIIIEPIQCSGSTYSPNVMVTADTKEELEEYIINNNLQLPKDALSPSLTDLPVTE